MPKNVFITGSSSGIGKETALYFYNKNWNVIATMRQPDNRKTELHRIDGIDTVHLDVLDKKSIAEAVDYAIDKYQQIDVLINNAGFAAFGPFEGLTERQIKKQFETNVFGLMDVSRQMIPFMRRQKDGVIINVSSIGGRISFPLYSIYNSSKWAVEGFSESLLYELKPFNIKVKIVEPGIIKTNFYSRSKEEPQKKIDIYNRFIKKVKDTERENMEKGFYSHPKVVAKTIYKAANDNSYKLRYKTGRYSTLIFVLRSLLPESLFRKIFEYIFI
ncbi:MAG: SDR family oxidoreductase [Candidatus Thermoplasmatota archaeon]